MTQRPAWIGLHCPLYADQFGGDLRGLACKVLGVAKALNAPAPTGTAGCWLSTPGESRAALAPVSGAPRSFRQQEPLCRRDLRSLQL
jgi:hypothetical protein